MKTLPHIVRIVRREREQSLSRCEESTALALKASLPTSRDQNKPDERQGWPRYQHKPDERQGWFCRSQQSARELRRVMSLVCWCCVFYGMSIAAAQTLQPGLKLLTQPKMTPQDKFTFAKRLTSPKRANPTLNREQSQRLRTHKRLRLGVIFQAHGFEATDPADHVFLFGLLPILGTAALVTLTGNIVTMATGKGQASWGGVSLVLGTVIGFGLLPFFAEEGAALTLIPLLPAAALIGFGIANLVLGLRRKAAPSHVKQPTSKHANMRLIPWFGMGAQHSVQGGISMVGRF